MDNLHIFGFGKADGRHQVMNGRLWHTHRRQKETANEPSSISR